VIGSIPDGTADDVDKAGQGCSRRIRRLVTDVAEEAGQVLYPHRRRSRRPHGRDRHDRDREAGMPKWLSQIVQAGLPINSFNTAGALAESYDYESTVGNSLVVKEPVGVVGCITPWNYPLHQIAAKVAYAMAAGCTVVLKPSEIAPLRRVRARRGDQRCRPPAGVFNLVTGVGPVVGEAIAAHPDIDMVSFTGSTRAGKRVAEVASQTLKRVAARARRQVGQHPPRRPRRCRLREVGP